MLPGQVAGAYPCIVHDFAKFVDERKTHSGRSGKICKPIGTDIVNVSKDTITDYSDGLSVKKEAGEERPVSVCEPRRKVV